MTQRRGSRKLFAGLTAAGLVVAGLVVTGGSSAAAPVSVTLNYTCPFPLIGTQQVSVTVSADIPGTIAVGTPSPQFAVDARANAGQTATQGLNLVGAATVEGSALADSTLTAPEATLPLQVPTTVPVQPVPPNGNDLIVNAHGNAPSVTFSQPGTARINVGDIKLTLSPKKADGTLTGLGTFDSQCAQVAGQNNLLATIEITPGGGGADTTPPSVPANLHATGTTTTSVSLAWDASTDNVGVTGYDVFNGATLATSVTGTSATISGLTPDTSFSFTVKAKDAAGNMSAASAAVTARTQPGADTTAPSVPANLHSTGTTADSVSLAWDASTDNVGVTGYDVFNGATLATSVTGTSATIGGLAADTAYTFTVKAKDAAGNMSAASAAVTARTQAGGGGGGTVKVSYNLTGSTTIKMAHGTAALSGGIDAELTVATGNFVADLTLNPTTGKFRILGFLPATAKIEFVQAARTMGTFTGGVLSSTSKVTVKLPRVSLFGFPISNSPNCRTVRPADIGLKSGPGFDPLAGGKLSGVYTLPSLTGCGLFNGLISALTAGPGNTIDVTITPKAMAGRR